MSYTIIGVVGHIDHGKTSLVRALTGMETDTHPEERRRGITIDLGFATFRDGDRVVSLIDAPGHQRYIGNLLAGVSGIDAGLLVTACDQGIQQQTREHTAILKALGISRLVVAMSRIDLVDDTLREIVREDLELFLDDQGFSEVPLIPVSTVTGAGIEELKSELCHVVSRQNPVSRHFRMPIDRVLSFPGRGCVVAGTVWSGSIHVGDALEIPGRSESVRIRDIEIHGNQVQESRAGFRTAVNLAGISAGDVRRGDELVAPGIFHPGQTLLVDFTMFPEAQELRCPITARIHTGTTACSARITGVRRLIPGQQTVILVETSHSLITTYGQTCLFRLPYPVGTFGGGRIVASPNGEMPRTRRLIEHGRSLATAGPADRLVAWTDFLGEVVVDPVWCEHQAGLPPANLQQTIMDLAQEQRVIRLPDGERLVSVPAVERSRQFVKQALARRVSETPDAWLAEEAIVQLATSCGSPATVRLAMQQLVEERLAVRLNGMVALATEQNQLSKKQAVLMQTVFAAFSAVRATPTISEVAAQLNIPRETVRSLSRFPVQQGTLIAVGGELLISATIFRELCEELHELFGVQPEQTVAAIRDRWGVTRKHAVPYLEYCDRMKITANRNGLRTAGSQLQPFLTKVR